MAQTSFIGRFFRFLGRSIDFLGRLLSRLLLLLFVGIVLVLLFSGPEPLQIPEGGLVVIEPKGAVVEQAAMPDPTNLLLGASDVTSTPLRDILDALERAAADERIAGVMLSLGEMTSISPANLETVGEALEGYKTSGKALIAHGDYYGQAQYLLASYADTVYLHPMGQVLLPGYGGSQLFFSELLDKLGVNVHIFRVGTHKAAVEPFSLNGMSDESRANSQQLVDELWQRYLTQVAANRGLSEQLLRSYTNDLADHLLASDGDTAQTALSHGLVDELISQPELRTRIRELAGAAGAANDGPHTIGFQQYLLLTARPHLPMQDEVGVIVAQGTIDVGEQPRGTIGADSLNALIREARMNDRVKAVVLRVDSPGGSALASELIRQELEQLQSAGKPLVVSMGGTAASGGYWIAMGADKVLAEPGTITGSIGVVAGKFNLMGLYEKLGLSKDHLETTANSTMDWPFQNFTPAQRESLLRLMNETYKDFVQGVAKGRKMEPAAVEKVAQGRVWTGEQARERGLVDGLGGFNAAIDAAKQLAKIPEQEQITLIYLPKPKPLLDRILDLMESASLVGGRASPGRWLQSVESLARTPTWTLLPAVPEVQ